MQAGVLGFETGDLYFEDRVCTSSILERVQDPSAEWNNLGVWINDGNFSGVLTVRNGNLVLVDYKTIIDDPSIFRASIRKLNRKFDRQERYFIQDYYRRLYSDEKARSNVTIVSRVFQRMAFSSHPKVRSPEYIMGPNGLLDSRGNTLQPYKASKTDKALTIYGVVSSLLAQAKVFGLGYNPEIALSDFNEGGPMDFFLQPPQELKQEPPRKGKYSTQLNPETRQLLSRQGQREGSELLNLYYENYYFIMEEVEDEQEEIEEMDGINFTLNSRKANPRKVKERATLLESEQNHRRAIRNREIQERLQPSGISYV